MFFLNIFIWFFNVFCNVFKCFSKKEIFFIRGLFLAWGGLSEPFRHTRAQKETPSKKVYASNQSPYAGLKTVLLTYAATSSSHLGGKFFKKCSFWWKPLPSASQAPAIARASKLVFFFFFAEVFLGSSPKWLFLTCHCDDLQELLCIEFFNLCRNWTDQTCHLVLQTFLQIFAEIFAIKNDWCVFSTSHHP